MRRIDRRAVLVGLGLLSNVLGCDGGGERPNHDPGDRRDGGHDRGQPDARLPEVGPRTDARADRGPFDAEVFDAQADARPADLSVDAQVIDARLDATATDLGPVDQGTVDLGSIDQGPIDTCQAGCNALVACGLSDAAVCAAQCTDDALFAGCDRALATTCDAAGWLACLDPAIHGCLVGCGTLARCGLLASEVCLAECGAGGDALVAEALAQVQHWLSTQGPGAACDTLRPRTRWAEIRPRMDLAQFCRRVEHCDGDECGAVVSLAVRQGGARVIECLGGPEDRCDLPEFAEICRGADFQEPSGTAQACGLYCAAQVTCGLRAAGDAQASCVASCTGAIDAGQHWNAELAATQLTCVSANTCTDLLNCARETTVAARCTADCAAPVACGANAAACRGACLGAVPSLRYAQLRACVAAADSVSAPEACAAVAACTLAPAPPCEAWCQRLASACPGKDLGPPGFCVEMCDDTWSRDLDLHWAQAACVFTENDCTGGDPDHNIETGRAFPQCRPDPGVRGRACLHWCRAEQGCATPDGGAALLGCVEACGVGFEGERAQRFAASQICLEALPVVADCAELAVCLP